MTDIEFTVAPGATRREWCDECALPHIVTTIWGYINDDPTNPQVLGILNDCDKEQM